MFVKPCIADDLWKNLCKDGKEERIINIHISTNQFFELRPAFLVSFGTDTLPNVEEDLAF